MALDQLPFNWFDILLVITLGLGLQYGRKNGMSSQLFDLLKWLTLIVGCAYLYGPIGHMISEATVFSRLTGYLMAYTGLALIIAALFATLKRAAGGKLVGSDVFGRSEFYLGMLAGVTKAACILIALLALLNARSYSQAEITASQKFQNDVYGSNFFPTLQTLQAQVFESSLAGPIIRAYVGPLLIEPTAPEYKQFKQKEFAAP